ncbi:MAG TPA: hypothetical protein VFW19_17225 [Allosphingosinicella sp.]|nr:hypothetical protein [Allosphingosinicella sp.]
MSDDLIAIAFPFFLIGFWVIITVLLGFMSGWFLLQRRYGRGDERPLLTLRMRSGSVGGVHMSATLTLSACPSGLRVGIWRPFGPFCRPFLVPWHEIDAERSSSFFAPATKLHFGRPEVGTLKIDARIWRRLAAAGAPAATADDGAPVTRVVAAQWLLLQWLAKTILAGSFFYLSTRQETGQPGVPVLICFGFPALIFALAQAVRFFQAM